MIKAVVLAALLLAGLAFGETSLPAKVTIGDASYEATLDFSNGLPVLVLGEERHVLRDGASDLDLRGIQALQDLAKEDSEDGRYRAIPFELGDAQKNAKFVKLHLNVQKTRLDGFKVTRLQLEFRYPHQGPLDPESKMGTSLRSLNELAAPFPHTEKESYGVAFDHNVLPVRLLEIISQPSTDRHGNQITLRRARVVSLAEYRQADGRKTVSIYDVPATALLFLTPEQTAQHVERVTKLGMAEEEYHQAERYLLGEVDLEKGKETLPQLMAFAADHRLDVLTIQRRLLREETANKARAAEERERDLGLAEDAKRAHLLLSEFMEVPHDQRMARLEEIRSMVPLRADVYEQLIKLLEKFEGGTDVKETRETITAILTEAAPLPEAALLELMRRSNPADPHLALLFRKILQESNSENQVENLAIRMLTNEGTPLEARPGARRALVQLPASSTAKSLLLVALQANLAEVRESAMETLKHLGPYEIPFLLEIVKTLKFESGRAEVAELLIHLNPPQMEVLTALTAQIRQENEPIQLAAANVVDKLSSNFGNLDENVIAAIHRCRGNQ